MVSCFEYFFELYSKRNEAVGIKLEYLNSLSIYHELLTSVRGVLCAVRVLCCVVL